MMWLFSESTEMGLSSGAGPIIIAPCVLALQALESDHLGHVDFGVKWQILPLCIKGKFYAIHAFVHKGKILRHGCRYVHNDSILRHRVWRKIPL